MSSKQLEVLHLYINRKGLPKKVFKINLLLFSISSTSVSNIYCKLQYNIFKIGVYFFINN